MNKLSISHVGFEWTWCALIMAKRPECACHCLLIALVCVRTAFDPGSFAARRETTRAKHPRSKGLAGGKAGNVYFWRISTYPGDRDHKKATYMQLSSLSVEVWGEECYHAAMTSESVTLFRFSLGLYHCPKLCLLTPMHKSYTNNNSVRTTSSSHYVSTTWFRAHQNHFGIRKSPWIELWPPSQDSGHQNNALQQLLIFTECLFSWRARNLIEIKTRCCGIRHWGQTDTRTHEHEGHELLQFAMAMKRQ
jgi:hypothetical protein